MRLISRFRRNFTKLTWLMSRILGHFTQLNCMAVILVASTYLVFSSKWLYNENAVPPYPKFIFEPFHQPSRYTAGQPPNNEYVNGEDSHKRQTYIVNTPTCKIPDLNPWGDDILMLQRKCEPSDYVDPKCGERPVRKWMHTDGSNLIVNHTAIKDSGYSISSIRCCYYVITRVEQTPQQYDMNADTLIKYSEKCHSIPLYDDTCNIDDEFIRVFCMSNSWPLFNDVVYREYFAFAQPDAHALKKIAKWKSLPNDSLYRPPSIVIVGVDTNSRLNSHRTLKRTLKVLEEMGAVEFYGYTKVGENTYPNYVGFLAGVPEDELPSPICYTNRSVPFDECPFLYKSLDKAGYVTLFTEDAADSSTFNYWKLGFVKKPTDFYPRPLTISWMMQPRESEWVGKCVGRLLPGEMLLNYASDILKKGSQGAPVFIHSWMVTHGHHCISSVRYMDTAISKFLENVDKRNTIFILMSDHGDRYGPFRQTTLGWYEDKLPSMWIYLPENVQKRFPQWNRNLQINARRLTSHFDLYQTFVHILNAYNTDPNFSVKTPKPTRGQSLFAPVPENRTCESAGIPSAYCACTEPIIIDVNSNDETVQRTLADIASATISYLTKILPKECSPPSVKRLVSAKVMVSQSTSEIYVLSLYTDPGNFLYEVTVQARNSIDDDGDYNIHVRSEKKTFFVESLNDILRMNKITRKVNCLSSPVLERYCYCL